MVEYKVVKLEKWIKYKITPYKEILDDDILRYQRTLHNLNKMLCDGRPISLIIPEKVLDSNEIEEYRKYFCKKAKEDKRNYIYFQYPVNVEIVK